MALEQELQKLTNLENVTVDSTATVGNASAQSVFCKDWPTAKNVLTAAQAMVKNPVVKLIIGILISVGDGLQKTLCGQK